MMKCLIALLIGLQASDARQVWSRDPAFAGPRLQRRRFNQESIPYPMFNIEGCPGEVCGNLAGGSITPLLAKQPPCSQQDYADKIIDTALDKSNRITSEEVRKKLIEVAIKYRKLEKNAKPQYGVQIVGRMSLYCDKPPRHEQLKGLVQMQDPANDPTLFFDPSKTADDGTVLLGSQPNTFPFGAKGSPTPKITGTDSIPQDVAPNGPGTTTNGGSPILKVGGQADGTTGGATKTTPNGNTETCGVDGEEHPQVNNHNTDTDIKGTGKDNNKRTKKEQSKSGNRHKPTGKRLPTNTEKSTNGKTKATGKVVDNGTGTAVQGGQVKESQGQPTNTENSTNGTEDTETCDADADTA